jgi:hypothetical protein
LVTNGGFDTDSDWSKGTGWSISGGTANALSVGSAVSITQNGVVEIGKKYKITYTISNYVEGGVYFRAGSSANGAIRQENGTFTEIITQSGNTTFYFTAYSGSTTLSIDNVSVKEYLGQEVVPDSGCGSWLFEPQSTNLITYSEDFSSYFNVSELFVTENYSLSPDGQNNSTKISYNDTSASMYKTGINISGEYTLSFWTKAEGNSIGKSFNVRMQNSSGSNNTLITLTGDWVRHTISGNDLTLFEITNRDGSTISTNEFILYGFQLEALPYATSYIPTSGTSVTRNKDVCINGGSLASINSTEGVLYAEIAALADDLTFRTISISDGTPSNRCVLRYGGTTNYINVLIFSGGSSVFDNNYTLSDITDFSKIAVKWKENDFALWVNGLERKTDTSGSAPIGLSELQLSNYDSSSNNFYGKTKAVAVFPYLSDEELTELTTI